MRSIRITAESMRYLAACLVLAVYLFVVRRVLRIDPMEGER
jgi:cell division protein FtsW (lipid II flippase)